MDTAQTCSCLPSLTRWLHPRPGAGQPHAQGPAPQGSGDGGDSLQSTTGAVRPFRLVRPLPDTSVCLTPCFGVCVGGTPHLLPFSDPHGPPPAHERQPVPAPAPGGPTFLRVGTLSHCWVPRAGKRASQAGASKIVEKEKRERKKDYGLSQQGQLPRAGRGGACWGGRGGGAWPVPTPGGGENLEEVLPSPPFCDPRTRPGWISAQEGRYHGEWSLVSKPVHPGQVSSSGLPSSPLIWK